MGRAIIHIGMHKTGTSAIQRALSGLREDGIAMSCLAPETHNHPLMVLFGSEAGMTDPEARVAGAPADLRAEFEALLARDLRDGAHSILWSAEKLSVPARRGIWPGA